MDGASYDDIRSHDPYEGQLPPTRRRRPETSPDRAREGRKVVVPDGAGTPGPAPRAFHYATARTVPIAQLAVRLSPGVAAALTARVRRLPVVAVRVTSRGGTAVHAAPAPTPDALYVDHRDLMALEAGAEVPDLEDAVLALCP